MEIGFRPIRLSFNFGWSYVCGNVYYAGCHGAEDGHQKVLETIYYLGPIYLVIKHKTKFIKYIP